VLLYSRRAGLAFLAVAALIAGSRVVEGLHYPSDVLAGAAVGTIAALLIHFGARPFVTRLTVALAVVADPVVARAGRALSSTRRRR
jgi:undecaprenyl-diphosphatase